MNYPPRIMKRIAVILLLLLFGAVAVPLFARAAVGPTSPFHVAWDEGPVKVEAGKKFKVAVTIRVPADHYLYADKTEVDFRSLEGVRIDDIKFPRPENRLDPYFGKMMEVYGSDVEIEIVGHIPDTFPGGERELSAVLNFQGCSSKLCLRPEEQEVVFTIDVEPAKQASGVEPRGEAGKGAKEGVARGPGLGSLVKSQDFAPLAERGFAFSILIVFLAGVLVTLTPCIWPIVPVILLIIGVEAQRKWYKNIPLAATFVLGLVVVNALLGISAAALGKTLGFLFQYRVFLIVVVIFFVAMSLSMFGLFEFRPLQFMHERLRKIGGKGFRGALLMGLATGLITSPCASPVLAALLGYVGAKQSYAAGFTYLVVFGLGMGLVFILFGSVYGMIAGRWKGARSAVWVRRALGIILLIPALFYLRALVRWDGVFHPAVDAGKPRVEWVVSKEDALKFARQSGRPIMIEFYADWCPPCRSLETSFFKRDDIVGLSYQLVPLRIDATVATPEAQKAVDDFGVVGWPAFFFLSPDGNVYDELTVISYNPEKLEESMRAAISLAGGGPK